MKRVKPAYNQIAVRKKKISGKIFLLRCCLRRPNEPLFSFPLIIQTKQMFSIINLLIRKKVRANLYSRAESA